LEPRLVGLSQSRLSRLLIFKGGTALKRCHFGDYRFSEDLDFTLARPGQFAAIREGLEEAFEHVIQASGIRFAFDREDRQNHANSYTFYLDYQGRFRPPTTSKWTSPSLRFFCSRSNSVRSYAHIRNLMTFQKIT
jgi:predicted nucleotidyltransferase component of viral defense system